MYLDDEKVESLKEIAGRNEDVIFQKLDEDKTFGEVEEEIEELEEKDKNCSVHTSRSGFWLGCIKEGGLH